MKILFLGTPELAVPLLNKIAQIHTLVGVLTQPDRPKGRSKKLVPSPVALAAEPLGIPVFKPETIDDQMIRQIRALKADLFVTFAYGIILKKDFFSVTALGGINVHPSLLPRYRGPSPIQSALLNGDKESGITIQTVKLKVDSGDILLQQMFSIAPDDDAVSLEERIALMAPDLVIKVIDQFEQGTLKPLVQDESLTSRCRLVRKEEGVIDWGRSAVEIHNMVRAFCKWPVACTGLDGLKYSLYRVHPLAERPDSGSPPGTILEATPRSGFTVQCGSGILMLDDIQVSGKKRMSATSFLNGQRDLTGRLFDS